MLDQDGRRQTSMEKTRSACVVLCQKTPATMSARKHDGGLSRRLGLETMAILITSLAGLLFSTAMLCFLWWADHSDSTWRKIALDSWLPRSVTLLSAVIRWCVSGQALVATSMLAALAFSGQRMWLHQSASLSVMRYVNTGPSSLVWLLIKDPLPQFVSGYATWIIVLTIACTTILSQFCSTVLLSDFNEGIIVGWETNMSIASGYKYVVSDWLRWSNYWDVLPRSYPAFAEMSNFATASEGIDDTGLSLRGILPLASEDSRSFIHSFSGNATVVDSRVACSRPLYKNLTLDSFSYSVSNSSVSTSYYLTGYVVPSFPPERLIYDSIGTQFNCSIMPSGISFDLYTAGSVMSLCVLSSSNGGLLSEFDPWHNISTNFCWNSTWLQRSQDSSCKNRTINIAHRRRDTDRNSDDLSYHALPLIGKAYLLFNFTELRALINDPPASFPLDDWQSTPNGPWLETTLPETGLGIQSTLCFDALSTLDTPILASSKTNRTEPNWEFDPVQRRFITGDIRKQLGASRQEMTFQDRGVLSMHTTPSEMRQQAKALISHNGTLKYLTNAFAAPIAYPYSGSFSAFFVPRVTPPQLLSKVTLFLSPTTSDNIPRYSP
jgi:hypothetical protein